MCVLFCLSINVRFVVLCFLDIDMRFFGDFHARSENARRNAFVDFKNRAEIVFVRKT